MDDVFIDDWLDLQAEWRAGILLAELGCRPSLVAMACRLRYRDMPASNRRALGRELQRFWALPLDEDALPVGLREILSWRPVAVEISW